MGAVAALLSADAEFEPGRQRGLVMGSVGSSSTPWRCQRIEAGEGESHPASASNPPLYRRTGVAAALAFAATAGTGNRQAHPGNSRRILCGAAGVRRARAS